MKKNPVPQGKYRPAARYGNLIFSAGMTPRKDGKLLFSGKIKADDTPEMWREAVRQAADNALTAIRNCLEEGESIRQILNMTVYINTAPDFRTHAAIGDLASEYLCEELGEAGIGARACIGMTTLPGDAPVEIQLIAAAE